MAVPACIVSGVGALLLYQNTSGDWGSWSYAWSLIPGFVGIGTILAGLCGDRTAGSLAGGAWMLFVSLVLFVVFGSWLGKLRILGDYWPALLIVVGVLMLLRPIFGRR